MTTLDARLCQELSRARVLPHEDGDTDEKGAALVLVLLRQISSDHRPRMQFLDPVFTKPGSVWRLLGRAAFLVWKNAETLPNKNQAKNLKPDPRRLLLGEKLLNSLATSRKGLARAISKNARPQPCCLLSACGAVICDHEVRRVCRKMSTRGDK